MLLANISQPLLGLVDTYVVGHMPQVSAMAGVALGAMLITQLYWLAGTLRMSATGYSAQTLGSHQPDRARQLLWQLIALALIVAALIGALQRPLCEAVLWYAQPDQATASVMQDYVAVRVLGAPAALLNLVLIGWLIGRQRSRFVMLVQIIGNGVNAGLNLVFVYGLNLGIEGVALATVCAEYLMCVMALLALRAQIGRCLPAWFSWQAIKQVLQINSAMLIRNLALQACLAWVTLQGAQLGDVTVAVNSVLLQFLALTALGLDAVAYAAEALVGQAAGQQDRRRIQSWVRKTLLWSLLLACVYSLIFYLAGEWIIRALTDLPAVRAMAVSYLPYAIMLPLVAHWCFLLDGVYIGLGQAAIMRNSMLLSALAGFFLPLYLLQGAGNHGVWLALLSLFVWRGVTLGGHFWKRWAD